MTPASVSSAPLSPLSFLARSASVFADRPAVLYRDTVYTYRQLGERVGRAAAALRNLGIQPGDRVAYLCPNVPALLEAHFAVPLLGAVLVAINTRLAASEVAYILEHSGAKVLILDSEYAPPLLAVLAQRSEAPTVISVCDTAASEPFGQAEYESLISAATPLDLDDGALHDEMLISLNYTSGTTGFPKGVMFTHRGSYLNSLALTAEFRLASDSTYLWTLPMFHCNGWCFPWAVTAVGGTHICLRKVDPALVADWVCRARVSHMCGAPTVLIMLANDPTFQTIDLPRKLIIGTGGAPPAPQVIRTVERLGAELIHVYGLTETYGPFTLCEWHPEWNAHSEEVRARLKARQGVAHITAGQLRVVDENMREVPWDGQTLGEIVMRGNSVMKGYFGQPEATEQAFRGGWFHSGDLAVRHPDGYLEIRDRGKDIIISGGENISTVEVERTLYDHPAVLEVAVIGIPDGKWGEVPKAFVTLRPAASATAEEIIEFCRARIAHFKCPKAVEFGDLPKTSTGKIQKYVLREREWKDKEKRVN